MKSKKREKSNKKIALLTVSGVGSRTGQEFIFNGLQEIKQHFDEEYVVLI